jgi:hypothetical protein
MAGAWIAGAGAASNVPQSTIAPVERYQRSVGAWRRVPPLLLRVQLCENIGTEMQQWWPSIRIEAVLRTASRVRRCP